MFIDGEGYLFRNSFITFRVSAFAASKIIIDNDFIKFGSKAYSYSAFATRCSITSGTSVPRPIRRRRNSSTGAGWIKIKPGLHKFLYVASTYYIHVKHHILSGFQLFFCTGLSVCRSNGLIYFIFQKFVVWNTLAKFIGRKKSIPLRVFFTTWWTAGCWDRKCKDLNSASAGNW